MSILKSLVDWEKSRRESEKQSKGNLNLEEEVSAGESDKNKGKEDLPNNFEKAKAHKSTMEAAISEVSVKFKLSSSHVAVWFPSSKAISQMLEEYS